MAVNLSAVLRYGSRKNPSDPGRFKRREEKPPQTRIRRKFRVKSRHIILTFLLIAGFFTAVQQTWIFLIGWDELEIRRISIVCSQTDLSTRAEERLAAGRLGNILFLDVGRLQDSIRDATNARDVRVRKVFPSSIRVEITARRPAALVRADRLEVIDAEGVVLGEAAAGDIDGLPVFTESGGFLLEREEKLEKAWSCLRELSEDEKSRIAEIRLESAGSVGVRLRGEFPGLILDASEFAGQFREFWRIRDDLEKYGPLETVDLRFDDRLYLKPAEKDRSPNPSPPGGE